MFTIRLVTRSIIVHTILVVCTIMCPPGRGVTLVWTEVSCHLRSCNKFLKWSVLLLSRMLVHSSLVRSFMSLHMLLAMVKKVFVFLLCPECWCTFFQPLNHFL